MDKKIAVLMTHSFLDSNILMASFASGRKILRTEIVNIKYKINSVLIFLNINLY